MPHNYDAHRSILASVSASHQPNLSLLDFSFLLQMSNLDGRTFSPLQYENWAEGEPNGNASYSGCVRMYTSNNIEDGIWDDYFCDSFNQFICKTPKGTCK